MTPRSLHQLPAFTDNYFWLIREGQSAAVVDPGDAAVVKAALQAQGCTLSAILLTHHHADHIGGVAELARDTGAAVIGHAEDAARLPALSHAVRDGERFTVPGLSLQLQVLATYGHTLGHISYVGGGYLFCGDTLFSGGCGRLFEGSPLQMWDSLSRLAALPDATLLCCAHEYTLSNLRYAVAVMPNDLELAAAFSDVSALRAQNLPSVPLSLGQEKRRNIFLRANETSVAAAINLPQASNAEVFAALRKGKDSFRG